MESLEKEHQLPGRLGGTGRRRKSNLAVALILLPRERRADAFLFYDFCRTVDEIADSGTSPVELRREHLDSWIDALKPGEEQKLPVDFLEMIRRRKLDCSLLTEIVAGMRMDTEIKRYRTFENLRLYCWRVASAVGLVSAGLFGAEGEAVKQYAEELGLALQLTNILRDVAEDAAMDRIYLPINELERFGVSEKDIFSGNTSPQLTHLLNHQAERADAHFARAELAWLGMSPNQRRLMRPARLMSAIYRTLLLQMHRDRYDVLHKKYRVSNLSKAYALLIMLLQSNR